MKTKKAKGSLVITIPIQKPSASKSGKTLVIASSRGVKNSGVLVEGKEVWISLNAFVYPRERGKRDDPQVNDGDQSELPFPA